jgi:molybdenum cofactor biosynthesis enzyme MoaA
MDTTNNKFFCFYPFRAIDVLADSSVVPCCRFDGRHERNLQYVSDKNSIDDAFNSDYFNNLRKKMLAGEKVSGCWKCYKEDEAGIKSMRLGSYEFMEQTTDVGLEFVELESGRFCNLKCRSCSPKVSSGFHNEIKSSKFMAEHFGIDLNNEILDPANQLNKSFLHISKEQAQKIKYIKVTGGEPLLSEYFLKYIQNLNKWDLSKNITLEIYTNASFLPKQKLSDALKPFKKICLFMSIDAIGKKSDYLRSGSNWNTIEKVAKHWYDLSTQMNMELNVSTTISIYNVLYLKELIDWIQQTIKISWPSINFVHSPSYMCVSSFNVDIRNEILNILKNTWDEKTLTSRQAREYKKIINFVENTTESIPPHYFFETTETIDKIRNEDWKQLFPELYSLLSRYKNSI